MSIIHDLRNFWQLIYNLIVAVYNDRASRSLYRSIEVFSCFLTMAEVAQDIGRVITLDGHTCGIGILSIFDTVFRYLPIFLTVLRYWVPPMSPSLRYASRYPP